MDGSAADLAAGLAPDLAADLDALAARVAAAAADVRSQQGVVAGAGGADWVGPASRAFREALRGQADRVGACASALDDLAQALRAHAATVRSRGGAAQRALALADVLVP